MALCRRHPRCPSTARPSRHPSYTLQGFPLRGLRGSFCCGGLCGRSGRLGRPVVRGAARPCPCGCCRLLFSEAWSPGGWLWNPRGPWLALAHWWLESASQRLWGCCPPPSRWSQMLALVPDYWPAEPVPGVRLQGQGCQRPFQIIEGEAGSWPSWVRGPGCREGSAGLLVGGARPAGSGRAWPALRLSALSLPASVCRRAWLPGGRGRGLSAGGGTGSWPSGGLGRV